MSIDHRCPDIAMTKHPLDGMDAIIILLKVVTKLMTKAVRAWARLVSLAFPTACLIAFCT